MEKNTEIKETMKDNQGNGQGPKYTIDIEGTLYDWNKDTITTEEIAELGGLNISDGIIEINSQDGTERNLLPGETVEVKPGQGFSKKIKFKRG